MDRGLALIGRLATTARSLEREGAYNGSKLVRLALEHELVRHAEATAGSGGAAAAAELEALAADFGDLLPASIAARLPAIAATVRAGGTIALAEAPRARLCRFCGEVFVGDAPAACPRCEAPDVSFHEELPVWYLDPIDETTVLVALRDVPARIAAAVRDRTDEQLAAAPAPGEWSVRQTLEHLLFAEELFETRIARLLAEDEPDLAARAVWSETPASDEGTADTGGAPASSIAARLIALRAERVAVLSALSPEQWRRAGRHPEWGRVTVLSQAGYFARHQASHLAQLVAAADGRLPGRGRA